MTQHQTFKKLFGSWEFKQAAEVVTQTFRNYIYQLNVQQDRRAAEIDSGLS